MRSRVSILLLTGQNLGPAGVCSLAGPCRQTLISSGASFHIAKAAVDWWDTTIRIPIFPSRPNSADNRETGYLLATAPVASVAYETPTQQGVTGEDGGFRYEEGETANFPDRRHLAW